ncbi:MAG: hypothetical protein FWF44_07830 [Defluviitaleaceae bacterium]|nr:hypothetical protein [Defluviitaleaceae bacterium]
MKHSKRTFVLIFAAVLALCLALTACQDNNIDSPTNGDSTTVQTGTADTTISASSLPAATTDGGGDVTPPAEDVTTNVYDKAYAPIIAEWKLALYKLINDGDPGNPYDGDLSFQFYDNDTSPVEAYYALYDIDGNGTPELILRKVKGYEDIIAYIFSIKDGKAVDIFGNDDFYGGPKEVPWSRVSSSSILSNGLIDSMYGNIYKIADDGCSVAELASCEPYDYPDEADLAEAKWKYYINNVQVDYDFYVQYLSEHGYLVGGNNTLAIIDWININ